jgi:ribonuclease VapC
MVIDTSAILAILLGEPEAVSLVRAISAARVRMIGAPSLVEASAVLCARKGRGADVALDALLQRLSIITVAMSPEAAAYAREAYRRFGKGVGQPGVLNYGDCLAYGVAVANNSALLFTGHDFSRTDVAVAEY